MTVKMPIKTTPVRKATIRRQCIRFAWGLVGLVLGTALIGPALQGQNQGAPAPTQPLTFFDSTGDPLVSGTISTYVTGTSTSAITYSDLALNSRNANPVVLNSAGRAAIFLSATQVYRFIVADSSNVIAYTQDGIAAPNYVAEQQALELGCDGRMTVTSGVPVTTASVTDATTIYFTPDGGNRCALYDGTDWRHVTFSEVSLALGTDAASTNYDLFAYLAGTTLTLERTAWANQYDRTTNLTRQNGVLVRSGAATRRYLGTYRTTATIGETEDSLERRLVWNVAHRVPRLMRVLEDTNSWSYTAAMYRQVRDSSANQLLFVLGDTSLVTAIARASGATDGIERTGYVAIGQDTTSTPLTNSFIVTWNFTGAQFAVAPAEAQSYVRVGAHTWTWLERGPAAGTINWFGDDGGAGLVQTGLWGFIEG